METLFHFLMVQACLIWFVESLLLFQPDLERRLDIPLGARKGLYSAVLAAFVLLRLVL